MAGARFYKVHLWVQVICTDYADWKKVQLVCSVIMVAEHVSSHMMWIVNSW